MAVDLNDIRKVALSLPPNERIMGSEVADVLSGLIALQRYGKGLLDATNEGTVSDFFHEVVVADAKARGIKNPDGTDFVPTRGARPTPVVPGAPVPGTTGAEVADLSKQVQTLTELVTNLVTGLHGAQAPDAPATTEAEADTGAEHVPDSDNVLGDGIL